MFLEANFDEKVLQDWNDNLEVHASKIFGTLDQS